MRRWFLVLTIGIGALALSGLRPPPVEESATPSAPPPTTAPRLQPTIFPTDPVRGPTTAPLTIIEFADFTCPACREAAATLATIREEEGDDVRIIWKDFPHLDPYTQSMRIHIATRCAQDQGKFWEYHDAIFATNARSDEELRELAAVLHLDAARFNVCRTNDAARRRVDAASREASRLGLNGTPTFFVNGQRIDSADLGDLRRALDARRVADHSTP